MKLTKKELEMIKGGNISATLINALSRAVTTIMDVGKIIGSSIKRLITKNFC